MSNNAQDENMNHAPESSQKQFIRNFWAANPMTYGTEHGTTAYFTEAGRQVSIEIGTREFFDIADNVFYSWNTSEHNEKGRFGKLFDYDRYVGKPVLELGCGMGCMAMNWAQQGARITAVDLNPVAVAQTKHRFEVYNLDGVIQEADAENLPFNDHSFSYVYSWGVLHHTPNTKQAIDELFRVLEPGGRGGVMLYHRNSIMYKYLTDYIEGFLHMEDKFLNPVELASRYGDGERKEGNPHTWPVTKREVKDYLFDKFENVHIYVLGTEIVGILDQWNPNFGSRLPKKYLNALIRRWGWSLWITGEKAA